MSSFAPPTIGDVYSGVVPPVRRDIQPPQRTDLFVPTILVDPVYVAEPAALPSTILSGDNPNDPTPPSGTSDPAGFMDQPPVQPLMAPDKPVALSEENLVQIHQVTNSPPKGGMLHGERGSL